MAHYAFINELNIVTQVIVGKDENDLVQGISSWEDHYSEVAGKVCKRTSYNTYANTHKNNGVPYRYNFAGVGFYFNESIGTEGAFIPPKPFDAWVLNENTCQWNSPIDYPQDGKSYLWDNNTNSWVEYV